MDQQKRFTKSVETQKIANAEIPWMPLYESPTILWMGKDITGASPSVNFMYTPWAAKIGKK